MWEELGSPNYEVKGGLGNNPMGTLGGETGTTDTLQLYK